MKTICSSGSIGRTSWGRINGPLARWLERVRVVPLVWSLRLTWSISMVEVPQRLDM